MEEVSNKITLTEDPVLAITIDTRLSYADILSI
jgi:hypothetical protein